MSRVLHAKTVTFPRLLRIAGFVIGVLLFSDGLRRFFTDLQGGASAIPSMIVGMGCMFIAGYGKTIAVSPEGFVRETAFWGAGRKEVLRWEDMDSMVLAPSPQGTSVLFSSKEGERGWRAFFPAVTAEDLRAMASEYGGDIEISEGKPDS